MNILAYMKYENAHLSMFKNKRRKWVNVSGVTNTISSIFHMLNTRFSFCKPIYNRKYTTSYKWNRERTWFSTRQLTNAYRESSIHVRLLLLLKQPNRQFTFIFYIYICNDGKWLNSLKWKTFCENRWKHFVWWWWLEMGMVWMVLSTHVYRRSMFKSELFRLYI